MIRTAALLLGLAGAASAAGAPDPLAAQAADGGVPFETVRLDDLAAFRAPADGWRVAGSVAADRSRRHHLEAGRGSGVLVNLPARGGGMDLVTAWEHGDLELELEVLMPRESNSGLYFQGRYELQLLDSWGKATPTFADAGGIYQRWDESRPEGTRGFEGIAPRINASRAPGLWQHFHVVFRAPRFDAAGRKTENARFVRVVHNGAVIHENVEVTGPTRSAAFAVEAPMGPLVVQGDHGPVALRKIRYKRYSGGALRLSELRFRAWEGEFGDLEAATAGEPARSGAATGISTILAGVQDRFALAFDGTVAVPAGGPHRFQMRMDWIDGDPHFQGRVLGGARLRIADREVLVHEGRVQDAHAIAELPAGDHRFSLTLYKNRPWTNRTGIALFVEGPGIARHPLHDVAAAPSPLPNPILVRPLGEPALIRGFLEHGGRKLTHVVSVGDPTGVHFGYDMNSGALLHAWRGPFLEATDMWHARGEHQLGRPLGSVLALSGAAAVARLTSAAAPWPDSTATPDFRPGGYTVDRDGRPAFVFRVDDVAVEDRIRPSDDGASLRREMVLTAPAGTAGVHVRLAEAERIERQRDGSFVVGDRRFYVVVERGGATPMVRESGGRQELLVPVRFERGPARVTYSIIW
jgi:hypothetical protein